MPLRTKPKTQNSRGRTLASGVFGRSLFAALLLFGLSLTGSAQIAQRGSATTAISTSASVTISRPTGVVSGDVMIANIGNYCSGCTQTSAALSGWTLIAGTDIERGRASLLYKVATGSEPSSYTFGVTSGSTASAGAIVAFSGVINTNPFDVTASTSWTTVSNQTISSIPSITTATGGAAVLVFGVSGRITTQTNSNFTSWTSTSPTLTEIFDVGHNNAGNTVAVGGAWGIRTSAGSTGNGGFTCTPNTNPRLMGGIMIALRPCGTAGTLSGTQNICVSGTSTFSSDGTSGGSWSSNNTAVATVNSSTGVVTGVAAGTATITYTVSGTGGCANATATRTVTVTAAPNAGTLSGTQNICVGGTTTFSSNGAAGGAWSSSNTAFATVNNSTGVITVVAAGTATITYTVTGTGGCANATATRTVTVTAAPNAGTLSGTQNICVGGSTTFSSNGGSGAWTTSNSAIATINSSTGAISGIAAGTVTMTYTVIGTGGCSNATATRTVTVADAPVAGTLSGDQDICINRSSSFASDGNSGGSWSSNSTGVATVNSSTGLVSGVSAGNATITYTVTGTGGCSNVTATRTITVLPSPAAPLASNASRCGSGVVSISANANSGQTIDWYAAASGGAALSSGTDSYNTPSISATTTYYAEARNISTGCISTSRTAVTATVNPAVTGLSASNTITASCGTGTANLSSSVTSPASQIIGLQNFESSGSTMTYAVSNGSVRNGSSGSGDRPQSSPFFTSSSNGYSANNTTATITTQNLTGLGSYSSKKVSMRLAAFSFGSTTAGLDGSDYVRVSISLDGGSTYSDEVEVDGNSNAYWAYSATGVASVIYDGDNNKTNFAPSAGGSRTTDGFSTIEISLPDNVSQVRVRVTMVNSSNNELWVVDDLTVAGVGIQYSWTSSPAGFTSSLQNPGGVALTGTTDFTVTATNLSGCSAIATTQAVIQPLPAAPVAVNNSRCQAGSLTISATPGAGETIDWYAAATGGSPLAGGTGTTSITTPNISGTTLYYAQARNTTTGCISATRTVVTAAVSLPSISSVIPGNRCGSGPVTMVAIPSAGANINWYTTPTGGSPEATGNSFTTPNLGVTTTYYIEAFTGSCVQPSRTAINANVNPIPGVNISASYCTVPGKVVLTATSGLTYLWSTGQTTQIINVDQAGVYSVTGTTAAGCSATANFGVATELVTNGSFNAGNTGFTTAYNFVADQAGVNNEMWPEGTYSIVSNPNTVHPAFYGADRNGNGGQIMVINGSVTAGTSVWNQNNITVLPNTTYYFSAWTMSVVNGSNAALQFSINGTQVGTVAYLENGYTNTAGPYNWVRFYGQWNSGPATSVNLSIINMNQIAGGNDFALDDISFGTMSPIALVVSPVINSGASACQGSPLVLNTQASGGASPFSFSWTGPNGFTSSLEDPQVTATASAANNGTYTVLVTDGFGCTSTSTVVVSVAPLPANQTITAASASVCTGGSTSINLGSSETGVYYQLRNNADNSAVGTLVQGTGAALSLPTGVLNASSTFNVLATRFPGGCSRQLTGTVTVNQSVTPQLVITNQSVCSGTVNLTAAAVTAGSTGSGTLTYWTNAAATTALTSPSAVAASGTYFIKSTNGSCSDVQAVIVSINSNPTVTFTYGAASYCSTGSDPVPSLGGAAGVFTASPAGMVFVNNNTGEIDLSASAPGTYTVTNTVTPSGACAPKSASQTVTITAAPLAGFSYTSNDFCQSANALNASPVFDAGAAAGTFSSSAGLSINSATGIINVSASTPGNYAVLNTRSASGGCPSFSDTTFLDINPYIFTGGVSAGTSKEAICLNETVNLFASGTSYATVLLRERFNGGINNWVQSNNSTGGNPANASWTLRPNSYNANSVTYNSNDASQFYLSSSVAQGSGGNTNTILRSPVMSTVGFSTLSLDFFHFFDANASGDTARVQISTNNVNWTTLNTWTSDRGTSTGFVNEAINLNAYIGLPTVYIRFQYRASNDRMWAIDNVSVTGNSTNYSFSWASSPVGYSSALQAPTAVAPVTNTFYIATATNGFGCSNPASPVPVTVNPLPGKNAGADRIICGSGLVGLGAAATAGNTYGWSPATGLSDASAADPDASPASTTTYTLTQTISATGCTSTDTVIVSVQALPAISSSTDGSRCGNGTVSLSAVSSTGTLNWFASAAGGSVLATGSSFTTPSLSATTIYYAEATSASCQAASRIPVTATISAFPVISAQTMPAATYNQNQTAAALSVTATVATGTLSYAWYSNTIASATGGVLISGSNQSSFVPPTSAIGTSYYYCIVSNNFGCTATSAVSGLITTIATPVISVAAPTIVAGQSNGTGFNGQVIEINGSNFPANATVSFIGVPAASVQVVSASLIRAVVNNTGASVSGNLVVTNPTTGASASKSFEFIGYTTDTPNFIWSNAVSWMGDTPPAAGSDVYVRHNGTITGAGSVSFNSIEVKSGTTLTLAHTGTVSVTDLDNSGTITWTGTGNLGVGGTISMSAGSSFVQSAGTLIFNKAGDQTLFAGTASQITFNNLVLSGSGVKNLPAGATITAANLTVSAGTTLSLEDASRLEIQKDMTVSGTLVANTGTLAFTGAENSIISGNLSLYNLEINKSVNTSNLALASGISVVNQVNMQGGDLNLNGFQLDLGSTGNLVNETADNCVTGLNGGTIRAVRNLNAPAAVNVAGLGALLSSSQNMGSTEVIRKHNQVIFGAGYSISRRYEIHPTNNSNLNATFVFSYFDHELTSGDLSTMEADLDLWRFNGTTWDNQNAVVDEVANTLTKTSIPQFSEWTAAGMNTPLPLEVAEMKVSCGGMYPVFSWKSLMESNTSHFVVETSADGRTWKTVGTISAAGNSSDVISYSMELKGSPAASRLVRLVVEDLDGTRRSFDAQSVPCAQQAAVRNVKIAPNPNDGLFAVHFDGEISDEPVEIRVLNTMGIEVAKETFHASDATQAKMDLRGMAAGIYQVMLRFNGETSAKSFKVVIK